MQKIARELRFGLLFDLENFSHIFRRTSKELASELGIVTEKLTRLLQNRGLHADYEHFCAFARVFPGDVKSYLELYKWHCFAEIRYEERSAKGRQIADRLIKNHIYRLIDENDLPGHVVLLSGDGHFTEPVIALKKSGRVVHVVGWAMGENEGRGNVSKKLKKAADEFISYEFLIEGDTPTYKIKVPFAKIGSLREHLARVIKK
jgi:hypothetical protein